MEELLEIEVEEREFLRNSTKLYLDKVITEDGTKKRDARSRGQTIERVIGTFSKRVERAVLNRDG